MLPIIYMLWSTECFDFSVLLFKEFCFIVIYCLISVTGEPEEECVCVGVSWWVGGSVRSCVCVYIVIVKYFPCI